MEIKIAIVSHRLIQFPNIPYHFPICAGANKNYDPDVWNVANLVCDNTNDNISDKNSYYNELTAQYWMWKNIQDVDYVGLCHYRRYFNFSPYTNKAARVGEAFFKDRLFKRYSWNKSDICKQLGGGVDAIVARPEPGARPGIANIKENHEKFDDRGTLWLWSAAIAETHPEYLPFVEKYINQRDKHMFNMFIMKKKLFDEYSEWLFDVLFLFEKKWQEIYGNDFNRVCGLVGEHLLNVFILYQIEINNLTIRTLQTVMIYEPSVSPSIKSKVIGEIKKIFTVLFPYGTIRREKIKYKMYF